MAIVVVERDFEVPAVFEDVAAQEEAFAWCLEENGVNFLHTYFAIDKKKMVCVYNAPDAEAVRRTQRQAAMPVTTIWSAETLIADGATAPRPDGSRAIVVVERKFPETIALDQMRQMLKNNEWCFTANAVDVVDTYVTPSCDSTICVFTAPDAEAVRKANRTLKLPAQRVWSATFLTP